MNRNEATALVIYLSRAVGVVPTTGAEWDQLRPALLEIEAIANGKLEDRPKPKVVDG